MHNNKFTVVQIIDRLNIGGAERVLVTLSNILYEHGHTVKVITTVARGPLAAQLHEGIQLVNLNRKWKWNLLTMFRLIREVKAFDVIHVHSSHNLRYLYAAIKIFGLRKQLFFHEHFGDIEINQNVSWHQRLIYPETILIAVSQKIKEWALHQLKMDKRKVFLLPNIISALKTQTINPNHSKEVTNLLLVSNIRTTKNIEFAVRLFQKLNENNKSFYLTIIGRPVDTIYFKNIQQQIRSVKLSDQINFIYNCNNIQHLLHQFDLAIHTASSESGPLVLIEYMAQGLLFVTSNKGEVVQQIKDDLPELIVDDFNVNTWIEKIDSLLHHKNRDHIHSTIQKVFEEYYSPQQFYDRCLDIYNKGLNN